MEPTKNRPTGTTPPKTPLQSEAGSLAGEAKDVAAQAVDRAKELASDQLSGQKERSAGQIGKVATALRRSSEDISDSIAAPYIERAASMLDSVSNSVRTANLRQTVRSTESFARREPLLFLGGAFALGLLAARFLKSSAHRDGDDQDDQDDEPDMIEDRTYGGASGRGSSNQGTQGSTSSGFQGTPGGMRRL